MPLHVVIVGAGVAGVTAAAALHQAGHTVTVVEKSQFAREVGAALNLTPNGCRVLRRLGFDFARAGAVSMKEMTRIDGTTLEAAAPPQPLHGDYCAVHRGDLHSELMRIAEKRVTLRLGTAVAEADVQTGRVKLADGSELTADLIVGADGVHSTVRRFVLGPDASPRPASSSAPPSAAAASANHTATAEATPAPVCTPPPPSSSPADLNTTVVAKPQRSGCSAFRFLLPTSLLESRGDGAEHIPPPPPGTMRMYVDPSDPTRRRHLMWYACRNGTLQNFVGVHPDPAACPSPSSSPSLSSASSSSAAAPAAVAAAADDELDPAARKALLLREFGHFHSQLRAVLDMASEVRLWPLFSLAPLPRWSAGCAVLIGDAAHPMLPFSGQGANQAIEDAGALGFLFFGLPDATLLPQRLALFERVRVKRASRVQIMSRAVAGWEKDVQNDVAAYCEEGVSVPTNVAERFAHDALFDVYQKCQEVLEAQA